MRITIKTNGIEAYLDATASLHNAKDAKAVRKLIKGVDDSKWPKTFAARECNVSRQQFYEWTKLLKEATK